MLSPRPTLARFAVGPERSIDCEDVMLINVLISAVRWDRTVRFGTVLLLIPYYTVKATIRRIPYRIYGVILEIRRSATALDII